jgi:hypothetical protein
VSLFLSVWFSGGIVGLNLAGDAASPLVRTYYLIPAACLLALGIPVGRFRKASVYALLPIALIVVAGFALTFYQFPTYDSVYEKRNLSPGSSVHTMGMLLESDPRIPIAGGERRFCVTSVTECAPYTSQPRVIFTATDNTDRLMQSLQYGRLSKIYARFFTIRDTTF